jgi:hypothetical protein
MIITETIYFDNIHILKNKKQQLNYLKTYYENSCYKKLYIKKIKKILHTSKSIIDNNDFNLYYKTDITFDVDTFEIKENDEFEIKITDKHPKLGLVSKNDFMFVYILNSINIINKYEKNNKIKVKVERVKYNKNTNKIIVISTII